MRRTVLQSAGRHRGTAQLRNDDLNASDAVAVMPYAGVGYERGSVDVRYAFADPYIGMQNLSFTQGGAYRFLAGISIMVSLVTLNADFNVASMNGFSARVGVEI